MKPFNLELAKKGCPVCTRDGQDVRIICFDRKGKYPIIALELNHSNYENCLTYTIEGHFCDRGGNNSRHDLMMKTTHHEGWVNIYKSSDNTRGCTMIYDAEKEAKNNVFNYSTYITTTKIEWEE